MTQQLDELTRTHSAPERGTAVVAISGGLAVTLPSKEVFRLSAEEPDWPSIAAGLTGAGRTHLHGGSFLLLLPTGAGVDRAAVARSFFGWMAGPEFANRRPQVGSWDQGVAVRVTTALALRRTRPAEWPDQGQACLHRDLAWASVPSHIRSNHHGMQLMRALLLAEAHLDEVEREELGEGLSAVLTRRLPEVLEVVYGEDGWCGENSPAQDMLWLELLRSTRTGFSARLADLGLLERLDGVLDKAQAVSRIMVTPTGHILPRGDSPRTQTGLEHVPGTHWSERAGIWIHSGDDLFVMATGGQATMMHKHVDDTQVLVGYRGADFFIDGGYHSYAYDNPVVAALRSPRGHSVLGVEEYDDLPPWKAYVGAVPPRIVGGMESPAERSVVLTKELDGRHRLRRELWVGDHVLETVDSWELAEPLTPTVRYLLADTCRYRNQGRTVVLERLNRRLTMVFDRPVEVRFTPAEDEAPYRGWYSQRAHRLHRGTCLEVVPQEAGESGSLRCRMTFTDLGTPEPAVAGRSATGRWTAPPWGA